MAVQLVADGERRRLYEVRPPDPADRIAVVRWWDNDEPLLPFTINSALPSIALPRATAEAAAQTVATNVSLVSRPADERRRLSARFRRYAYSNETPATVIDQYVSYDSEVSTSSTGGPSCWRTTVTPSRPKRRGRAPLALSVGYTNNHHGYDARIFESTNEHVLHLKADAAAFQGVNFRARYEYGRPERFRTGRSVARRDWRATGIAPLRSRRPDAQPVRRPGGRRPHRGIDVQPGGGFGADDYDDSTFGLQEAAFRNVTFGLDYQTPNGVIVGGSYDYERYSGFQQSRSASPANNRSIPTGIGRSTASNASTISRTCNRRHGTDRGARGL